MKNKKEIPLWAQTGHAKPMTRREMLQAGVIPFSAYLVPPSIATLLSRTALGADCADATASAFPAFITLNLSGGAGLAAQPVIKTINGDRLSSYSLVGLGAGPDISFAITKEFGTAEFAGTITGGQAGVSVSRWIAGVRGPNGNNNAPTDTTGLAAKALQKAAFVVQCVASGDDSSMNKKDVTGLVLKMGLKGSKLPNLGRVDNGTGISQQPSMVPPPSPFIVNSVDNLVSALGYTAGLAGLNTKQKGSLARLIASLSSGQLNRISQVTGAEATRQMIECVGIKNADLVASGGGGVNPFLTTDTTLPAGLSAMLTSIWGSNQSTNRDAIFGAMVYNGLMGNAATINLNLGGYDYHNNTRATGDGQDFIAGQTVGRILATAEHLQKPVFIYVCSDGAVTSANSQTADSAWMSDRGIAGCDYLIAYDPKGRPIVSSNQIGGFNNGQAADGNHPTGNNVELAAQGVFANYAAWSGQMDYVKTNRILGDDNIRGQTIKFAPRS